MDIIHFAKHMSHFILSQVSFFIMHRLPQYYPEPEEFRPERWDPDQETYVYTYQSMHQ